MAEYVTKEQVIDWFRPYGHMDEFIPYETMVSDLRGMPAADVAPVRHGRWVQVIVHVEFEDGFVDRVEECCSACHEPNGRRCTYFCPSCGAMMDGGADNG